MKNLATEIKNARQLPNKSVIIKEKSYCDLLYAWLQCNSERSDKGRMIPKVKIKWQSIEKEFTRIDSEGKVYKEMSRKTIAKYFEHLKEKGLIHLGEEDRGEDSNYYYLTTLAREDANLIEYHTLMKLTNVLQRNSLNIYSYLINQYYYNRQQPYIITIRQIKDFIGIATSTTSNNMIVDDTLDILRRLQLIDYRMKYENEKSYFEIQWVRQRLPEWSKISNESG